MDLIPLKLVGSSLERHKKELDDNIRSCQLGLKELHEVRLPNWRKTYEAIPAQRERSFPWVGASNLVVPLVAIHSDTLLARVMAAVFKTKPIWVARISGSFLAKDSAPDGEALREALEEFMSYNAMEPTELDLYRVYEDAFGDVIRYGTVTIKALWEEFIEYHAIAPGDGSGKIEKGLPDVKYRGPRPEKIPFEDFLIHPYETSLERAWFKAHRKRMLKHELMERRFSQYYDAAEVDLILEQPDRTAPYYTRQLQEQDAGIRTTQGYNYAEWDVFECWHYIRRGREKYKVVSTYHPRSKRLLRAVYSPYPDDPFVGSRLFIRDGFYHGYGFAELLGPFQEEISQIHNQRRDSSTVANANMLRVSPNSQLGPNYRIYPGATLPAGKDEAEAIQFGQPSRIIIDEEKLTLDLAERRSGVSPPMQGYGAGTTSKRGVYTAMGTLSLLQEGNTRTDLNVSDLRYMHTKLGRLFARQYGEFGLDDIRRFEQFGERGPIIKQALEMLQASRILLPITSATASVNREVEKQNDILLNRIMTQHYGMITQMLMGASSPGLPEPAKDYVLRAIKAADTAMKAILRHFGYDEPEILVPEPNTGQGGGANAGPQQGPPGLLGTDQNAAMAGGGGVPGLSGMAGQQGGNIVQFPAGQRPV